MSDRVLLKGSLEFIGLGELLQQLGGSNNTGVIKLVSPYAEAPGYIYLKNGNPINAEHGKATGIEALNSFFGWKEASFEFLDSEVRTDRVIKKGRMEIILDGLRMVDDGLVPILGTQSAADVEGKDESGLPVVKGPIVDYVYVVDEEEFPDGKEIVTQDKFGNWFWVILEGVVEVIRIMPEGHAPILRLGEGAYIGSIVSFLREGNVRSASIVAVGRVQLGVLDSELIAREYSTLSETLQNLLVSIDKRMKQVTDVCAGLVLKKKQSVEERPTGTPFISSDQNENDAFLISQGKAFVHKKAKGSHVHLCTLEAGDVIGRIPFINTAHEPYSAEIFVSEDFECDPLDLRPIEEEYDNLSKTFKNMIQNMINGLSVTTDRVMALGKKGADG